MDEEQGMNDEIAKIIQSIKDIDKTYKVTANNIRSDYNNENETKDSYIGRQISELLQNADDCYSEACPNINVKFELRGNIFIVQNNGKPFSHEGINSLMFSNNSSKSEGTIGCKGLGFRSVLNWTNRISIYTKNFNVSFSEEKAKEKFQEYKNYYKNKGNQDDINIMNTIDRIAILSYPEILSSAEVDNDRIENAKWLEEGFSTAIVLYCNSKESIDKIQKELTEFRFEELLFLKHIRNISIKLPNKPKREIKAVDKGESISIQEGDKVTDWTIWKKEVKISQSEGKNEKNELIIAYNNNEAERKKLREEGVLYSYFKTDIPMPFSFLVHGTFDVTSERNSIKKENHKNQELINALINFIVEKGVEMAAKIATNSELVDYYAPLKFVLPAQSTRYLDSTYNFSERLKQKINSSKLFPTIGGKYISVDDSPRYSDIRFDKYVSPQTFDKLLKHCDDYIVHSYINNLSSIFFCQIGFYSEYEMVQLINKDADDYVAKKLNGKIIKLFSEKYTNAKNAPKLLVDSDGKRIAEDDVTIFNNEDNKFSLPEWSKMRFINCELEKELCKEFSCNAKQLTKKLVPYGCKEYSFNNVIAHLEEQIKNDIQKTKDVFRWLYEIFKKQSISKYKNELPNSVNVISRTGKIIGSNECYFGKEYGNEIGERITSWLSNVNYVASCTELGFEESELDSVKTFLSQFGVGTFPIVKQVDYRNNTARDYQRYNCEKYPKLTADNGNDNGKKCECNDGKEGLFYHSDATSIRVADIKGVEEILKNADYKDILYWILKDSSNLKKRIESENEIDDESCMCGRPYKSKETKKVGKDQMRSWLRKKFTEAEWLPTKSGKKVNCFGCTIKPNELSPLIETLKIDYKGLAELMGKSSEQVKKDVESLFEKLGVAKDIANLPYKKVIKILQDLPNNDADCELGKKFYKELRGYFNKESTALSIKLNPEYNKFCINGKVLAEVNGNVEYFPIRDVFYVGNKINCQDIIKHYPIFILKNRGDEKIAQCFGIKSISEIGSIDVKPNIHPLNEKFVDEYKSLLPYIYAKLLDLIKKDKDDRELNLLKESQIILVENAVIQHIVRGQLRTGQLNDYELIYAGKVAYIKIPKDVTTLRELSANYDFVKNTAEAIIAILDIDVDKDSFAFIFSRSVRENERYFKDNLENVYLAKEKLNKQTDTNYFDDEDEEELLPAQNNGDNKDVARSEEIINDEDADDNQNGIKPNATKFNEKTYSGKLPESEQRRSYAGGVGYKRNRANYPNMTEDNQYIGFNAENAVYQVLVYKFGEKSVKWRSTNGSLAAKIGQGVDGLGYDISYIDAEGKQHYVEVKGTGTNILDFNLTKNEFEFGLKHKEEFEVWRVFNYENPDYEVFYEVYRIKKFDKIFDCKDIFNSPRFKVTQTINYSFKVK